MSGHEKPDAPGLWKAAHGGYGVMFHDDGEPAMLLFGPGAKVRALDAIGPYTRLQPGVPVGSAPVPNLPGLWMDKDGSLYFLSGGRRVWRIRDDHEWMAEELGNDPWNCPNMARTPGIRSKPSKRSRGSRPPTIPLRFMRGAAPCISRMSDRSDAWNRTSGLP